MSTLPGILRVSIEVRNKIYAYIVATDQPSNHTLIPTACRRKKTTMTSSSLGLLSACHQLRGEFLDFFIDHREHAFKDPLEFANKYLATIGNTRRIDSLRHLVLSWPIMKQACTDVSTCNINPPHRHADVPSHVSVKSHMRHLSNVMQTYPELREHFETITLKLPRLKRADDDMSHDETVYDQVIQLLENMDKVSFVKGKPRRYFVVQSDFCSRTSESPRVTQVLIWAVTKEIWDKVQDGRLIYDPTCVFCKTQMNNSGVSFALDYCDGTTWVHPENCTQTARRSTARYIYKHYNLDQMRQKNWKIVFHGQGRATVNDWSSALRRHEEKKTLTRKRKRVELDELYMNCRAAEAWG